MRPVQLNVSAALFGALLSLCAAAAVSAVQVKLTNGTVLNGEIVDQNDNFIVIQVGQARLSIAKNTIGEIVGQPAGAPGAGQSPAPSAPAAGTSMGKKVEVSLKYGSKFRGAIAAMDDKVIELETESGSRVVLYKVNVTGVRDLDEPAPPAPPVPSVPAAAAPAPAPKAAPAEAVPGKMVEITLKTGAQFKGMVTSADDRHILLEVARGSTLDFYRQVIVDIRDLSVPGVSADSPAQTMATGVPSPTPAPAPAPAREKPAPAPSAPAAAVPAPKAAPAEAVPGRMVEITLKSGAQFKGVVVSADDRYIKLEVARGSTLDFYRNVIAGIADLGKPPTPSATPAPQPAPAPVSVPVKTAPAPQPAPALVTASAKTAPVSAPSPAAAATPAPAPVSVPVKTPPAPSTPVSVPSSAAAATTPAVMQQKKAEGGNELRLKNGITLKGSIDSANDRYVVFSTPDMTVNVLRRLITSVDGAVNADTMLPVRGAGAAPAPEKAAAAAECAKALSDSSAETRRKAVSALGAMGDTIAVLPLVAALRDSDGAVRKAAAEALGDLRDPRAVLPLLAALREGVDSVAASVRFSLKLHTEIPLLIGALDNRNNIVRGNTAFILWLMTGRNFGNDKQKWVDWYAGNRGAR